MTVYNTMRMAQGTQKEAKEDAMMKIGLLKVHGGVGISFLQLQVTFLIGFMTIKAFSHRTSQQTLNTICERHISGSLNFESSNPQNGIQKKLQTQLVPRHSVITIVLRLIISNNDFIRLEFFAPKMVTLGLCLIFTVITIRDVTL